MTTPSETDIRLNPFFPSDEEFVKFMTTPTDKSEVSKLSPYDPVKCLREEVDRFKSTNKFTPMLVTNFYAQAACVLDELATAQSQLTDLRAQVDLMKTQVRISDEAFNFHLKRASEAEAQVERLHADGAVMRSLLETVTDHACFIADDASEEWNMKRAHAISTDAGRDLLARYREAVELLRQWNPHGMGSDWIPRRDTLLATVKGGSI